MIRLDQDVDPFAGRKEDGGKPVRLVEESAVRPHQVHAVPVEGELEKAGITAVDDLPALDLSSPYGEARVYLAVDHHQLSFLAVHILHRAGVGSRRAAAEGNILQDHDMWFIITQCHEWLVLNHQCAHETAPVLLGGIAVDMGVVEVDVSRVLCHEIEFILPGFSERQHDPHVVGIARR